MIELKEQIEVTKSANFQGREMSIDPEFFNKMIWLVIKQYKYKVRTSLQELISNAVDAQVDAENSDRPLKITLPTRLVPTFILRDYGTGMNPDTVNKIYCNMGASGSSHTNTKKGGFGIGGKSPLGFCDQYNIKTFVDGKFWFYAVYKNELNGINVDLINSGDTIEENGTEIIIPSTKDQVNQFRNGAFRATYFWDTQPIFNDDDVPVLTKGLELSDKISVYDSKTLDSDIIDSENYYSNTFVLVDGIPYYVDRDLRRQCSELNKAMNFFRDGTSVTYAIGNGEIKVLQTRESLEECKITIDKLNEIGLDIQKKVDIHVKAMKKATLKESYETYKESSNLFRNLPTLKFDKNFSINANGLVFDTGKLASTTPNSPPVKQFYSYSGVEYTYRSKRGRYYSKNTKSRRVNNTYNSIRFDNIPKYYIDDLSIESETLKARRCKFSTESTKDCIEYLKSDCMPKKLYNSLVNDLGIKLLSSLPLPPKAAKGTAKAAKKLASTKIDMHVLTTSRHYSPVRSIKTIDLPTFKGKVIWCDYSTSCEQFNSSDWTRFFADRGYKSAYIGKKFQKQIENDDRFIKIKDFISSFKLTNLEMEYIIIDEVSLSDLDKKVLRVSKKTGNPILKKLVDGIVKPHKDSSIPKKVRRAFLEGLEKEVERREMKLKKLKSIILTKYPLLGYITYYEEHRINDNIKSDMMLDYMIKVNKNETQRRL